MFLQNCCSGLKETFQLCLLQAVFITSSIYFSREDKTERPVISENQARPSKKLATSDGKRGLSIVTSEHVKSPRLRTRVEHVQASEVCVLAQWRAATANWESEEGQRGSQRFGVSEGGQSSCPICMGQPEDDGCALPECGHVFCKGCIQEYVARNSTETKTYPMPCPQCPLRMDTGFCLSLFSDDAAMRESLEDLIVERVHHNRIRYCANPSCATPFDWVEDTSSRPCPEKFKVMCPFCKTATCVKCKDLWHDGKKCFEMLSERQNDLFFHLVDENEWQECPSCGQLIERHSGHCNFLRCRCGCGFCHKCGVEYQRGIVGDRSLHGRPRCNCTIFG